jgi:hypothetical protein
MKKTICTAGLLLALAVNAGAFELPGGVGKALTGGGSAAAPSAGVSDLLKQVDAIKGNYAGATNSMTSGREKVLSAFGLKTEAAALKTGAGKLSAADVTPEKITAASQALGNADGTLKQAVADRKKLAKDGKKQFLAGIAEMAAGVKKDAALSTQVSDASQSAGGALKGASLADAPRLQAATEVLSAMGAKLPVDLAATRDTLSLCADYAKAFNIKVPAGVTQALAAPK